MLIGNFNSEELYKTQVYLLIRRQVRLKQERLEL